MRLLPAVVLGFALAFTIAFVTGYCIEMVLPKSYGSFQFYAAEFAGIVVSMTAFYLAVRRSFRRRKRDAEPYRERLA